MGLSASSMDASESKTGDGQHPADAPGAAEEVRVAALWRKILGLPRVGFDDNFFEAGGTSLLATALLTEINRSFHADLPIAAIFESPTVRAMAARLRGESQPPATFPATMIKAEAGEMDDAVAIIGMTGRFPGAHSVEQFWTNLISGTESITFFSPQELETGTQAAQTDALQYVAARPILEDADLFDAAFFGVYPKEAEQMDPQHRIFLECAWEVLERAGYDPAHTSDSVGVFAGCSMNTYFMRNLATGRRYLEDFTGAYQVGSYVTMLGNDKDFLATRVSYKLNLRGPSITVQSACSTSLVAVAQACRSLLAGECDMALAGAVSITFPQRRGYLPQEGGLASLDGHCRPFDQGANGTVFGHGAGIVLLKKLRMAQRDGDQILAVIRGAAVNNDGAAKVGFAAPSVSGQADVIARAHKMAKVPAESITYVEAHGTGTPLGDPIEIAALNKAFRRGTSKTAFCAVGTAKANIGHLDVAAGAAGLIKTVLQLQHRYIPKLLHFEQPNRHLDLADSPFFFDREARSWARNGHPLRAGVSAFGVGGTNAHVVVEESPAADDSGWDAAAPRHYQLLTWSGKSANAVSTIGAQLAEYFSSNPDLNLADAAYTLQLSRSRHPHRRALVAATLPEAKDILTASGTGRLLREDHPLENASAVFCFPGQGVQAVGMASALYRREPVFRAQLDHCDSLLRPLLSESLLSLIYPEDPDPAADLRLKQTQYAQPAIFSVEYALAQLWISWGIRPSAMVGHSIGEYVAACLAGVLSLEDALRMIAARGRVMQDLPPGAMLAVRATEDRVSELLLGAADDELDIAAVNGPQLVVVSGAEEAIDRFAAQLTLQQIQHRKLLTSHAFHSRMVDPALPLFADHTRQVTLGTASIPYVSTLTGRWISPSDLSSDKSGDKSGDMSGPDYWVRHMREPVRFASAIRALAGETPHIFLEVGPGESLAQMIRQNLLSAAGDQKNGPAVISSLPGRPDTQDESDKALLTALGRCWSLGLEPDWRAVHAGENRKRVLLPTYPFERKRYWVEPPQSALLAAEDASPEFPPHIPTGQSAATSSIHETVSLKNSGTSFSSAKDVTMNTWNSDTKRAAMFAEIRALLTDLSGIDLDGSSDETTFLELGFDSLFLTQLTQSIQSKYRVKLTFRQLMEDFSTLAKLAAHVESLAPPAASVPASTPAAAGAAQTAEGANSQPVLQPMATPGFASFSPRSSAQPSAPSSYEALFAAQMQMMSSLFSQQLALLGGQPASPAALPAVSGAPSASATAAARAFPIPMANGTAPVQAIDAEQKEEIAQAKPVFTPFKPLQRGTAGGLSAKQESYLQDFIGGYNRRTSASKAYTQRYRPVFADGRVVSGFNAQIKELIYPLVVDRASGAYLWDKDGNRYIDILNGFGAILYGHSPQFIVDAVEKQLKTGFAIGPQTELAGECSELIRELTGVERVTFCNTGSEAVMGAMRLARTVTGRNLVALFAGDYHGSFDEVLVKSVGGNHRTMPAAPGIPRESVANILVLEYGAPESLQIIRQRSAELAAVLVEPVQSRHPELRPAEFLRELRRITEESGTALIFDEVVTGFRTHPGGMQALFNIRADLATYGKVVAGGLPVGVLAGSAAYMDALDGGQWQFGDDSFPQKGVTFYAGTFMRHPLAMAAVKASLEHLKSSGPTLQSTLAAKTASLAADLRSMFQEFSYSGNLESFSSWFFFSVPQEPRLARLLHFHLREQGIHIQEGFPCFLTTAHSDADLNFVRDAFRKGLAQMREGEALAGSAPGASFAVAQEVEKIRPAGAPEPRALSELPEPLIPEPQDRTAPITEPQREIFFGAQLGDQANCAFNESTSLVLEGAVNEQALIASIQQLVARHEALRATVDEDGETIHIAASLPQAFPLQREDLANLSEEERQQRLSALLHEEAATPFNLHAGPLFRMRLIQLEPLKHMLVLTAHHIVFDGWSTNVFYRELSQLYNAQLGAQTSQDPAAPFHEYALEQHRRTAAEEHVQAEGYWLDQFKTIPPPLDLPIDRPRAALRTNSGATRRYVVSSDLAKAIRKAGAREGSTLFATLLAAFSLLIHRLSQQDDVVVGIPMAGQSLLENGSGLIGHCVNFLPIRSGYLPEQSLAQFLKQTRKKLLDAQDHQDYTYGTLLRKLKLQRDPSRLQLVEVQFNLEQVGTGLNFQGLAADLRANAKSHVNMDLFFNFVDRGQDRGGEIWLDCDYNSDLFDATTIDRWFEHMEAILRAFSEKMDQPVSAVSLLSPAQVAKMLTEWNRTAKEYPRDASIHRVFEQQAKRTPHAIAVEAERCLSYMELNEKANQLARFLQSSGVRPGARVAICLERSLESIVSLLAILKAGAAYVPLDPSYPAARLAYLIGDSGVQVLLTERSVSASLPELPVNTIRLDADWAAIATKDTEDLPVETAPEEQAYVMYTSGSTGNPKGVVVPQRAVLRLVKNNGFASFSSDEVFLQLAPLSFDAATFEIWGALLNGGKLVLGPRGRVTPEEIGRLIRAHEVTALWLTAALFHLMVSEHMELLRPLKQLLAGGDVLSVTHVQRVLEGLPSLRLINGYGPTENTTFTCCHTITPESLRGGTVPIGRPIANTRVYLLDQMRKPVPPGVAGELYAAGDGLALGYLNAPELTAQKFIEHTLENGRAERLYRTGDLARFRPDGTIEFLGRGDTQVKIRGYRIELAEIEHALEASPLVRAAVVSVRTDWVTAFDAPGDKRLAAYVIPSARVEAAALIPELRKHLEERLPQYMQPAAIMIVESFPRTLNGKIDRKALPAPQPEMLMNQKAIVYPRNANEETLAGIWAKILGLGEVGVEQSIFELGGDSLLIFRITTLSNQAGLGISARDIFQYRTIAAICANLENRPQGAEPVSGGIQALPRTRYRRPQTTVQ